MNALWAPFLAVAAVFAVVAGGAAWWHQRRSVAELQRRLHDAESSRHDIAEHMATLRERLDGNRAGEPPARDDIAARRLALEHALDHTPGGPAEFPWLETMPAGDIGQASEFEPTRPDHLRTEARRDVDVNLEDVAAAR